MTDDINLDVCAQPGTSAPKKMEEVGVIDFGMLTLLHYTLNV